MISGAVPAIPAPPDWNALGLKIRFGAKVVTGTDTRSPKLAWAATPSDATGHRPGPGDTVHDEPPREVAGP